MEGIGKRSQNSIQYQAVEFSARLRGCDHRQVNGKPEHFFACRCAIRAVDSGEPEALVNRKAAENIDHHGDRQRRECGGGGGRARAQARKGRGQLVAVLRGQASAHVPRSKLGELRSKRGRQRRHEHRVRRAFGKRALHCSSRVEEAQRWKRKCPASRLCEEWGKNPGQRVGQRNYYIQITCQICPDRDERRTSGGTAVVGVSYEL